MRLRETFASIALASSLLLSGAGIATAQTEEYDRISEEVAQIRELELLEPLDIEMHSREELQAFLLQSLESYTEEDRLQDQRVLLILGLIEEGDDPAEIQNDLLSEQIAGYYDPETGQMVVVQGADADGLSANDEITFAHETVHALQDQHFDLMAVQGDIESMTDDEYLAMNGLIEGDATLAQVLYMVEQPGLMDDAQAELGELDTSQLDSAPLYMSESLLFPYDAGGLFVMDIYQDGGWDAVNEMYENPPQTTEQILHPEAYRNGEAALEVTLVDPVGMLGADWVTLDDNSFGEFMTGVFLKNSGASDRDAENAAEGWGGDAYYVVGNDDETALVWSSAWDSEEDADEFMETLLQAEMDRLEGTAVTDIAPIPSEDALDIRMRFEGADGTLAEIQRNGDAIVYYIAENEQTLDALIASQTGSVPADASPVASPVAIGLRD